MENHLAPTYDYRFGDLWVLWYSTSNSYSVVDVPFKTTLDLFLESSSLTAFKKEFPTDDTKDIDAAVTIIQNYLEQCHLGKEDLDTTPQPFSSEFRILSSSYTYQDKTFQVYYASERIKKLFHPSLAYLETVGDIPSAIVFDIYAENGALLLFKNKVFVCKFPTDAYHKVQGKFITELLSFIHRKTEEDWVGTFHGSTITDGNSALLFIGESGKGKSTLCTLLASNGFDLLADDVSPLAAESLTLHSNPAAVSIKAGAFEKLKTVVPEFESIPSIHLNKTKGILKYVPFKPPIKQDFPCGGIISVHYKPRAKTTLSQLAVSDLLQTLIPDSWLSPDSRHAEQFLNWLQAVPFYKLTYSDTESVLKEIGDLFEHYSHG